MPAKDADHLFETRSVSDVRVLESKMGNDIEQKKKDLRLMVGERYRDLIEAADSVAKMKDTSGSLQQLFAELDNGCNAELVKQKMKIEESLAKGTGDQKELSKTATYPVAVQIKLLVDTPEQIWNSIESNSYLRASRLWQAANTINRSLQQLDANVAKIPLTFPLVQRQWDSIKHFDAKILEKAKEHMKSKSVSSQSVAESLAATMLLERISSKHVFGIFLAQRKLAISETLANFVKNATSIPDLLTALADTFQITLFQTSIIFFPLQQQPPMPPLLDSLISRLSTPVAGSLTPNSIHSIYSEKSNIHVIFKHLPPIIQNHVPLFVSSAVNQIDKDFVKQSLDFWLLDAVNEVKLGVSSVLKHIHTGSQLATIREELLNSISEAARPNEEKVEWENMCVHLLGRKVSLWDEVFRSVFKELSVGLIEKSFGNLLDQVDTILAPLLTASQAADSEDRNVANFIWSTDLQQIKSSSDILCRVQTSSLDTVTDAFENGLEIIKADIFPLVTPGYSIRRGSIKPLSKSFFDEAVAAGKMEERDVDAYLNSFQEKYLAAVDGYQKILSVLLRTVIVQNGLMAPAKSIFIARIAKALAIKVKAISMPTLREDINSTSASIVARLRQNNASKGPRAAGDLESMQLSLMDVHMNAMKVWIDDICQQFELRLTDGLLNEDWTNGAKFIGLWETISIHSKDEMGQTQEDKLKLPVHTSSFIIHSLFSISSELNNFNGFVLEKPCLKALLLEIGSRIVKVYAQFLENTLPTLQNPSEMSYLQILFDYEFLVKIVDGCWIFDGDELFKETQAARDTKAQLLSVLGLIRSLIDPVDLAIAASYHTANVDRCYYRSSALLGALLALNPKPSEMKKTPSAQETHNIIAVASQPPRFTMLLTSLPGVSLPTSRIRAGGSQSNIYRNSVVTVDNKRRKARSKIEISANSIGNSQGKEKENNSAYSISGTVLSGVVGLVGAAGVSQKSLFGGAQSMFGALMGSGGHERDGKEKVPTAITTSPNKKG